MILKDLLRPEHGRVVEGDARKHCESGGCNHAKLFLIRIPYFVGKLIPRRHEIIADTCLVQCLIIVALHAL